MAGPGIVTMPALPYVYRVTKYDPADRDECGRYVGSADAVSDHGLVEAAYLAAVAAFAADTGVTPLAIREPAVGGFVNFGLEPHIVGHGLAGLFPGDLTGYHDGAEITVQTALELVRAMLRDEGAWCRLEVEDRFLAHIGYDQYLYLGSDRPCEDALAGIRVLGLFPERIDRSPHAFEPDAERQRRPAGDAFWARVAEFTAAGQAGLLEENPVEGISHWHRLTGVPIERLRAGLTPRARVGIWPGLSPDPGAVLATLPTDHLVTLVWEDQDGRLHSTVTDEAAPAILGDARVAMALSCISGEQPPLLAVILPDSDAILRARWDTERDQDDP
jgi:small subunit ribosomal protein S1